MVSIYYRMVSTQPKYFVSLFCLCIAVSGVQARDRYASILNPSNHYLAVSVGGGEANNMRLHKADSVTNHAGAAAHLALHYEWHKKAWILGMSVEAQYRFLHDEMSPLTDNERVRTYQLKMKVDEETIDLGKQDFVYSYTYQQYDEQVHSAACAFSLYAGYTFAESWYVWAGAKFSFPVYSSYKVETKLMTDAHYEGEIETMRELYDMMDMSEEERISGLAAYGIYDSHAYSYQSTYKEYIQIAPMVEVGYYLPTPWKKNRLRLGVYASYGIRLGKTSDHFANYENVDREWGNDHQSIDNLQNTIEWRPLVRSDRYKSSLPHNLEVGVHLTFLFDVTHTPKYCMCEQM